MEKKPTDVLSGIEGYYAGKLAEHGSTPHGADWNSVERQQLCFEQLVRIIQQPGGFSINDLGCGYGALYDYLQGRYQDFDYRGYDISPDMIRAAVSRHPPSPQATFHIASLPTEVADYGIACGIFSVRLGNSDADWRAHIETTLDALDRTSRRGFAFNSLTTYSDPDRIQDYLYYADPCEWFDWCKRRFSRQVALLHDYGPYEFTILVRK